MDVVQHAVDPEADEGAVALGLEVNVGGPLLEGVAQDVVERLHHGRRRGVLSASSFEKNSRLPRSEVEHPALGELLLRVPEARLQVVEALVHRLDVAARGDHAVDIESGDARLMSSAGKGANGS